MMPVVIVDRQDISQAVMGHLVRKVREKSPDIDFDHMEKRTAMFLGFRLGQRLALRVHNAPLN